MRLIAYTRTSTSRQDLGLEAQQRNIEAYCQLYSHELLAVHSDQASGSTAEREGLQAALAALPGADGLIVAKLDRLTRSVADLYKLLDQIAPASFVSVAEQLDTANASGRLVLGVLGVVAQWEREAIGERTSAALQAKKAQGKRWCNHAPYGYRWEAGMLDMCVEEGAQAGGMAGWRAKGLSWQAVADELNKRGLKSRSGKQWTRNSAWKAYKSWEAYNDGN